jgi:hypothetical protein
MLVFRSLALGLLASIVMLLATRKVQVVVHPVPAPRHAEAPTIIDAAPGLSATQLAQLVRLAPDERVTSIDDQPVANTLDAGSKIVAMEGRRFLDLTVGRDHSERRVLVLVH